VLLNANARQVGPRIIRALSHVVPENDLLLSHSPLEARGIGRKVIERGYESVFCGGGDGTFMAFANEIIAEALRARASLPRFGVLRLGTGNGLAELVGASPLRNDRFLDDVLRARSGEVPGHRKLDLLDVAGQRTPFAGVGVDGRLLNDFNWVKENWGRGVMGPVFGGRGGYFSAAALRTLPHYLTHPLFAQCEVINGSVGPAYRLDAEGRVVRLMMAAVSTVPFYGFSFRMFPFAGRRQRTMHLRLGALTPGEVLTHLPQLWKGEYFPGERIRDFHAAEVTVRFDRPMPLQVGGDAHGEREQVTFSLAPEQLELLDFSPRPRLTTWQ
jgi:diacylglycerol kinase family enzyme